MSAISGELLAQYLTKTGKSAADAEKAIKEKTQKFAGLLTEEAALFLLAKEAGVETDSLRPAVHPTPIRDLVNGQTNVRVVGAAKAIYPPKQFANKSKPGHSTRQSVLLADDTGEVYLTLWHEHTKLMDAVPTGAILEITNANVTEYNGQKQLNFGFKSRLVVDPAEHKNKLFPLSAPALTPLDQLRPNESRVCVQGTLSRLFPSKTFENDRGSGEFRAFELTDESNIARGVAWNAATAQLEALKEGQLVRIENAYTKENRNGEVELHLGDSARVIGFPNK
jgi:ssDNA-binding replication factor A large subunit